VRQFAAGDRIMFLRNERGLGVKNGSLGTVAQVSAEQLAVRLDDGRAVAFDVKDYAAIDHGYAATIHKSQGVTVDQVHVLATPGMDRHAAYVGLSRHRDGVQLHYGRDDFADDGKLALIWNRLRPTNPTRQQFEEIYRDYMDVETRVGDGSPGEVIDMIAAAGFTVTQQSYPHDLHYSAEQWVDIAFTFSNQLLVAEDKATELRARLIERIGPAGVSVGGDAVAIFATPN